MLKAPCFGWDPIGTEECRFADCKRSRAPKTLCTAFLEALSSRFSTSDVSTSISLNADARQEHCGREEVSPVAMDETAADVQTMTVLPSLRPRVCSMNPKDETSTEITRPAGNASHPRLEIICMPVLQQAADKPKHTPACQ